MSTSWIAKKVWSSADAVDCLIIGGGPAGLTAAIPAARFRLSVRVVDAALSRAALIHLARNLAGFPDGISGVELLERMREQARKWGARIRQATVERLNKCRGGFVAHLSDDKSRPVRF